MSQLRTLTTPNDFGPATVTRTRISRNGLGARLIVKGNPFSFAVDVAPCLPFQSLMGGQNAQSRAVRAGRIDNNALADGGLTGNNATTAAVNNPPGTDPGSSSASAPSSSSGGGGGYASSGGPFGYVNASTTGHR